MYAKIENGEVVEFPIYDIRAKFPSISFPEVILSGNLPDGYVIVEYSNENLDYNPDTHTISDELVVSLNDVKWIAHHVVRPLTEEEISENRKFKEKQIRRMRDELLRDSDWTQLGDVPEDVANSWKEYRKSLRDITKQSGFPDNVQFPELPFT